MDSPSAKMSTTIEERLDPDGAGTGTYDAVMFDIGDEPPTTPSKKKSMILKQKSLNLKPSIQVPWKSGKKEEVDDDRFSLGSYEDMNGGQEDAPLPPTREESFGHPPPRREELFGHQPLRREESFGPPPPKREESFGPLFPFSPPPDPSTRAKVSIKVSRAWWLGF